MTRKDEIYARQLNLISLKQLIPGIVVGAGTIGSWTTLGLAKLGVSSLSTIDNDRVEIHNTPNQVYGEHHSGVEKTVALTGIIKDITRYDLFLTPHVIRVREGEACNPYEEPFFVVSAVDSMESRRIVWNTFKDERFLKVFLDGRIGRDFCIVYCVNPKNSSHRQDYEKSLHSDDMSFIKNEEIREKIANVPCTEAAIIDLSFSVAAVIVNRYRNFLKDGETYFLTQMDITNGYLEVT